MAKIFRFRRRCRLRFLPGSAPALRAQGNGFHAFRENGADGARGRGIIIAIVFKFERRLHAATDKRVQVLHHCGLHANRARSCVGGLPRQRVRGGARALRARARPPCSTSSAALIITTTDNLAHRRRIHQTSIKTAIGTHTATTASASCSKAYNLIPHQTILENVELALTLSGVSRAERRAARRRGAAAAWGLPST